jgi:hypothetical protein
MPFFELKLETWSGRFWKLLRVELRAFFQLWVFAFVLWPYQ